MKKNKLDLSLSDVVVTDNFPVQRELHNLLKKVDSSNKWNVVCAPRALEFSKKSDGFTDEYKPLYKINAKEFDKAAASAKNIWIATCPDVRGDYLAYKLNEHVKKDLKLNCSVYRMRLSHISEDSILNAILNKQNITLDKEVKLKYEAYNVIDHAISVNVSKLFNEKFPFNFDIYLHTGILLDFIDSCSATHNIRDKAFYSSITLYNDEVISKSSPITRKLVRDKKIKRVLTLESLYYGLSGFISWYGLATNLYEAYAKGCITYPTSDTACRTPKSIKFKKTKSSKKNWGICFIKKEEQLPEVSSFIVSEAGFQVHKSRRIYEYEYSQDGNPFFIHKLFLGNNKGLPDNNKWTDCGIAHSLGCYQPELLYYIQYLGFSLKLIPWITYSLVKSGLIVYTTDSTVALTSFGKLILHLIRTHIPILLKKKYIINTIKGIDDLSVDDELKNFEFIEQRIDKVKVLTDASYETMELPKCSDRCICGKRFKLTVNNTSVFATCSNNKCSKAGSIYPIDINNGKIEVKQDDQFRKGSRVLKHSSKKSRKESSK